MADVTKTLRSVSELAASGLIEPDTKDPIAQIADRYAVAITPAMAALVDRGDPADPIARQFVPDVRELTTQPDELADPLAEARLSPVPGIVHRYHDRVLLKLTLA